VVLLVEVAGLRLLLTGDLEPPGQLRLRRLLGDLDVDVLKVPHHGSAYQDPDWLRSLRPELAVVSVGADNDYGHPAPRVLESLREAGAGDGGSANDASIVLLVEVAGLRLLLTGDLEPPGQDEVAALVGDLDVDVLKVPHHGSAHQDLDFLLGLRPELALISVGADNDYGHPNEQLIAALAGAGATVERTDRDGDVAVVRTADGLGVRTRG